MQEDQTFYFPPIQGTWLIMDLIVRQPNIVIATVATIVRQMNKSDTGKSHSQEATIEPKVEKVSKTDWPKPSEKGNQERI